MKHATDCFYQETILKKNSEKPFYRKNMFDFK